MLTLANRFNDKVLLFPPEKEVRVRVCAPPEGGEHRPEPEPPPRPWRSRGGERSSRRKVRQVSLRRNKAASAAHKYSGRVRLDIHRINAPHSRETRLHFQLNYSKSASMQHRGHPRLGSARFGSPHSPTPTRCSSYLMTLELHFQRLLQALDFHVPIRKPLFCHFPRHDRKLERIKDEFGATTTERRTPLPLSGL